MFERLNAKYGNKESDNVSNVEEKPRTVRLEEAKQLLRDTEMTIPEIARKTDIKEATLYYHSGRIRKKKTEPKKKVLRNNDSKNVSQEMYDNLLKENFELGTKYKELETIHAKLSTEHDELSETYDQLESDFQRLQKDYLELKNKLEEPEDDPVLLQDYKLEKRKHEALLKYLTLVQLGGN